MVSLCTCLNTYSFFLPFHIDKNEKDLWMKLSKSLIHFTSLSFGVTKKD